MVRLTGTYEDDYLTGTGSSNSISGLFGADRLFAGNGSDIVRGDADGDVIYGEGGDDILYGGTGNDELVGGAGADVVFGGDGNNVIWESDGELSGDQLNGGSGLDTLGLYRPSGDTPLHFVAIDPTETLQVVGMSLRGFESYRIFGGAGADTIVGWRYDDTLEGGNGADRLVGGYGKDILTGGEGDDVLDGGGDEDSLDGSGGDDRIDGGAGDDRLNGGQDADRLVGGEGKDHIEGGWGSDVVLGGSGNDLLYSEGNYADDAGSVDTVDGEDGDDTVGIGIGDSATGGDGTDTLKLFFIRSSVAEDWAFGSARKVFANGAQAEGFEILRFSGGSGSDRITAGGGDDILDGNSGNDRLKGGAGDDVIDGGRGRDILDGGSGDDRITANAGADTLLGGSGNDEFLIGFDGNAALPYRVGIDGGRGRDTVTFTQYNMAAVIDLGDQSKNDGIAYGKTFRNIEFFTGTSSGDDLTGGDADDQLTGGRGNDRLSGAAGDDRLVGGYGADILSGGAGRDLFDFRDLDDRWRADVVTDFRQGEDRLAFNARDLGFERISDVRLYAAADPKAPAGQPALLYETGTQRLWLDGDGAGKADGPDLLLTLTGVGKLALSDFLFA